MNNTKVNLKTSSKLDEFIGGKNRKRDPIEDQMEKNKTQAEIKRLTVNECFKLGKPIKVVPGVWKEGKKLEKLLTDICKVVNSLVTCSQKQTRLTATELVARPTYVEEFENLRDNINKAIMPRDEEA